MNRRIVLGIDADISPQTQHTLRVASSLLELSVPQLGVVLLRYETATLGCRALASGRNVMEALFGLALQLRQVTQ